MKVKQRIRWQIAAATRLNAAGAPRTADLQLINHSNLMSADVTTDCRLRALGFGYSGGDYWN